MKQYAGIAITLAITFLIVGFQLMPGKEFKGMQSTGYKVTTLAGSVSSGEPKDGPGKTATFTRDLTSIASDAAGNLYVNDGRSLRKITMDGVVRTLFGRNIYEASGTQKNVAQLTSEVNAGILDIVCIAVDDKTQTLYLSTEERAIYKLSGEKILTRLAGRFHEAEFNQHPNGDGDLKTVVFRSTLDIGMDKSGNIFINDKFRMIRKISPDGKVSTVVGQVQDTRGQNAETPLLKAGVGASTSLSNIGGMVADSKGNIYVSQPLVNCIVKVSTAGVVSVFAGTPAEGDGETRDGNGTNARFFNPGALAVDPQDNVFVADKRKVRKITPDGTVTTIAGGSVADDEWQALYKDGDGAVAQFTQLHGIACDAKGNIYVTDEARIRKIYK